MTAPTDSDTDRLAARPKARGAGCPDAGGASRPKARGIRPAAGSPARSNARTAARSDAGGAARPDAGTATVTGTITATGALTVYVPRSTWGYLADGHRGDPVVLAARVHDYIRDTLIPGADKIMTYMCPDAGTQFTADPFRSGRDADRHGFAVHGRLTIYAPRSWGEMLIDTDHPWPPTDDEIATDLDGFAKEVLNEKFSDHLALLCPGAGVWFRSEPGDDPW